MSKTPSVAGVLLAAGAGTRFGMPKVLAHQGEWLRIAVHALSDGGCDDVVVVLGAVLAAGSESVSLVIVLSFVLHIPETKNPDQAAGVWMEDHRPFSGLFYVARKPVGSNHHVAASISGRPKEVKPRSGRAWPRVPNLAWP